VGDVVHGDAGLADLLLQLLPERAPSHQVAGGEDADPLDGHAAIAQRTPGRLGGEVDGVLVRVLPELRHVDAEDPDVFAHGCLLQAGSKPNPPASVPAVSTPSG